MHVRPKIEIKGCDKDEINSFYTSVMVQKMSSPPPPLDYLAHPSRHVRPASETVALYQLCAF